MQFFPDQTITDSFRVVRKMDSGEDGEKNCYDWYEIDHHNRIVDKTGPVAQRAAEAAAALEDAMCEQDAATEARVSALEDAICELDSAINGGGETV